MWPCLHEVPGGVRLNLYVQPRASKNRIVGLQGDELKVCLTSPPVAGEANKRCCAFFAKLFSVAKSEVALEAGEKSRHKRLLISGVSLAEVKRVLEALSG